jgi:cholesterol transport system auxiliary component
VQPHPSTNLSKSVLQWISPSLSCSLVLLVGIALITSCSIRQSHPAQQTFLLEARRDLPPAQGTPHAILRIRPATVAAPFDHNAFVYRDGDLAYETDFYHQFLVPPRALITEATRQWLAGSGLFLAVLDPASRVVPTHTLEANLSSLYGDFRNPAAPEAVLSIQFHLLRETPAGLQIQFHQTYRSTVPLERPGADALARSWSRALEHVLAALESDLALLDLQP